MLAQRELGRTGMRVTLLGFGGIPIGRVTPEEATQALEAALAKGVNYFDTARVYQDSEVKMGEVLRGARDQVYISSKGIRRGKVEMWEDIRTSLGNLQTDYIDLYFVHDVSHAEDFERIFAPDGPLAAVKEARDEGLVGHIGISGHRPELLLRLIETGEFEVLMVATNIADLDFQKTVIPRANELGMGLIGMKPFAGGALSRADVALRYALSLPVTTVAAGMRSVAEVEENTAIAEDCSRGLTDEEREALDEEARALGARFCRQCGYCLPCSVGIDIPRVFLLERYFTRYWLPEPAKEEYRDLEVPASECVECGDCEERCPYDLPIIEMLKEAREKLEGESS